MKKLSFTEHPASVGENYFEHLRHALGFAGSMISGGLALLVHALLPFVFVKTGSGVITTLHSRMITNRTKSDVERPIGRPSKRVSAA